MLQILMGTINVFHLPPCKPSFDPEPISSVQTLRPNVLPSFNAQNNTSSSIAHSAGISVPFFVAFGFVPPFPKGSKYFRDPDRSHHSPSPSGLSSAAPLPADQKCARCYLQIPKRRCSFRRVERLPFPSLSSISFARRICIFTGADLSSFSAIARRPKFCDAKLNLGVAARVGGDRRVYLSVDVGLVT